MSSTQLSKDGLPAPADDHAHSLIVPGHASLTPTLADEVYNARVEIVLALRQHGASNADIAAHFGVQVQTVRAWLRRARKAGKIREDIHTLLDADTVYQALEVVHDALEKGDTATAIAVLKGRGALRTYSSNKHEGGGPITAIQIVYKTPDNSPLPQLTDVATLPGQIVGTPRSDPQE